MRRKTKNKKTTRKNKKKKQTKNNKKKITKTKQQTNPAKIYYHKAVNPLLLTFYFLETSMSAIFTNPVKTILVVIKIIFTLELFLSSFS